MFLKSSVATKMAAHVYGASANVTLAAWKFLWWGEDKKHPLEIIEDIYDDIKFILLVLLALVCYVMWQKISVKMAACDEDDDNKYLKLKNRRGALPFILVTGILGGWLISYLLDQFDPYLPDEIEDYKDEDSSVYELNIGEYRAELPEDIVISDWIV